MNAVLATYVTLQQILILHLMKHPKEDQSVQQGIIAFKQQEVRMQVMLLFCRKDVILEHTEQILELQLLQIALLVQPEATVNQEVLAMLMISMVLAKRLQYL